MLPQHQVVIHLVDMVARQNQNVLRLLRAYGINVLINGVGGALVPLIADALHRRQHFNKFPYFAAQDVPALADVAIKGQGLILSQDVNAAQIGVDAVGKGDINDAVNAAEGHGRLGAVARERIEPLSSSSSQQNSERVFHFALLGCSRHPMKATTAFNGSARTPFRNCNSTVSNQVLGKTTKVPRLEGKRKV